MDLMNIALLRIDIMSVSSTDYWFNVSPFHDTWGHAKRELWTSAETPHGDVTKTLTYLHSTPKYFYLLNLYVACIKQLCVAAIFAT